MSQEQVRSDIALAASRFEKHFESLISSQLNYILNRILELTQEYDSEDEDYNELEDDEVDSRTAELRLAIRLGLDETLLHQRTIQAVHAWFSFLQSDDHTFFLATDDNYCQRIIDVLHLLWKYHINV